MTTRKIRIHTRRMAIADGGSGAESCAYVLDVSCPKCRRRQTDRYPASVVQVAQRMPPAEEYRNVQCRCGQIYRIPWAALASATPLRVQPTDAPWHTEKRLGRSVDEGVDQYARRAYFRTSIEESKQAHLPPPWRYLS